MPDAMLQLAEDKAIVVEFFNFISPIRGIYFTEKCLPPIIGLDNSLPHDTSLLRCILAEELGHYNLGVLYPQYKAMRWAAEYLVPENDLLDVIGSGLYDPWEIAEHFTITEEFAKFRVRLFSAKEIIITVSFNYKMNVL